MKTSNKFGPLDMEDEEEISEYQEPYEEEEINWTELYDDYGG